VTPPSFRSNWGFFFFPSRRAPRTFSCQVPQGHRLLGPGPDHCALSPLPFSSPPDARWPTVPLFPRRGKSPCSDARRGRSLLPSGSSFVLFPRNASPAMMIFFSMVDCPLPLPLGPPSPHALINDLPQAFFAKGLFPTTRELISFPLSTRDASTLSLLKENICFPCGVSEFSSSLIQKPGPFPSVRS